MPIMYSQRVTSNKKRNFSWKMTFLRMKFPTDKKHRTGQTEPVRHNCNTKAEETLRFRSRVFGNLDVERVIGCGYFAIRLLAPAHIIVGQ